MPGPTAKNNPWAEELKKSHRRRSRKGLSVSDEEWGDDDEWEWEADAEDIDKPNSESNMTKTSKLPSPAPAPLSNFKTVNGVNSNLMMNGLHIDNSAPPPSNGTHNNRKSSAVINHEDQEIEEVNGKADIKIEGNLLTIKRNGPIDWSDDEYEEEEEEEELIPTSLPPPPPPPPPVPPPPPPPMPADGEVIDEARKRKLERIEAMKRKPTVKPDWSGLMSDICSFRFGQSSQRLKKVKSNDRSKPQLSNIKIQGKFIYDSEKKAAENDIFFEIKKGVKLRHVKTNDRSKPMLSDIRCLRRQQTKEERLKLDEEDDEEVDKLRDDLESTKQLLDLEVRSKKLLEKDNKRLAQELEKLRQEMISGKPMSNGQDQGSANETSEEAAAKLARRNSVAAKRHSVIRLLSESESHDVQDEPVSQAIINGSDIEEGDGEEDEEAEEDVSARLEEVEDSQPLDSFYEDEMAEIEEMREEVDEARKLAEEWEAKYKEMQRQMSDLEGSRYRKHSLIIDSMNPMIQKKASVTSEYEDYDDDGGDYTWMLRRELHTLNNKLKNVRDKRDIVIRERYLLQERIETLVGSIGNELESRKRLRKEINEMNETFKQEMREMMAEQQAADELEECYFSDDEDLVVNTHKKGGLEEDELSNDEGEEEDVDETIEEIVNQAEEDLEEDPGAELFENYPLADYDGIDEKEIGEEELETTRENLNSKVEKHNEKVQLMRKSNFRLKAKIDHLYDILQAQKEKHHDMRLELTRMLADIQ